MTWRSTASGSMVRSVPASTAATGAGAAGAAGEALADWPYAPVGAASSPTIPATTAARRTLPHVSLREVSLREVPDTSYADTSPWALVEGVQGSLDRDTSRVSDASIISDVS